MQQFDRITRDMAVLAGQACIRGTKIPAYTIANLAAQGVATADILERYPLLDSEDVLQAAAYTIRELLYVMDQGQYNVKSSLTAIQSGCQLLHEMDIAGTVKAAPAETAAEGPAEPAIESSDGTNGATDSADMKVILNVLDILQEAAHRSIVAQNQIGNWLYFYRDPAALAPEWWPHELAALVENAIKHYIMQLEGNVLQPAPVQVDIPADLPAIRSTGRLDMALGYLLTVLHVIPDESSAPTFERHLTAALTADGAQVQIQIKHYPTSGRFLTSASGDLGLAAGDRHVAALFIPGDLYATAALLVEQAGGQLAAQLSADTLKLVITLPVWQIPPLIGVGEETDEAGNTAQ